MEENEPFESSFGWEDNPGVGVEEVRVVVVAVAESHGYPPDFPNGLAQLLVETVLAGAKEVDQGRHESLLILLQHNQKPFT